MADSELVAVEDDIPAIPAAIVPAAGTDTDGQPQLSNVVDKGARDFRKRIPTLKDYVREGHPHHPNNHHKMRNLRHISDNVNETHRFDFRELDSCDEPSPLGPVDGNQSRSHSTPVISQYSHALADNSKHNASRSLPDDPTQTADS